MNKIGRILVPAVILMAPILASAATDNGAAAIANSNSTVNFICKPLSTKSAYSALGKPDMKIVMKDFGKNEAELGVMLSKSPKSNVPYLLTLSQYEQAFDSEEVTLLFGNFVKSPNVRDLAIMASTMKASGFDKKKKMLASDARFAYGLIHLVYQHEGGNPKLGEKLLKEAAKKNQYGARFVEGMRWARGYGREVNLTNAASWMLPTYEKSAERDGDLAQIIENEFFSIVFNPNYANRDLYIELMQAAEEQRQSLNQQLAQNSGNGSSAALFRADVYNLTVTRGQLLIELAEVTNAGVDLEKYKAAFAELSNQANPSIATVSELVVVTDAFQNRLGSQLAAVKKIEASAMPKIEALFNRTEAYVADAHSLTLAYSITFLASGNLDALNNDTIGLVSEIGVMRTKACAVRQGIIDFASRTNVELKPTDVAVGTNILAPRKKKSR